MADSNRVHCTCAHCRVHSLMGPLMIVTLGVLFMIAQFSRFSFGDLWPILLIVAGIILVAQHLASKQGHVSS